MGNQASTSEEDPVAAAEPEEAEPTPQDNYAWPANLYLEVRDMAAASFLVYTFGYMLDVARKQGLKGLELTEEGAILSHRDFTPKEVADLVMDEDNFAKLADEFPKEFDSPRTDALKVSLAMLQERAGSGGDARSRPLTLRQYDDKHQKHEMVYAVAVDNINKRITLAFRGTDNELAFSSNWSTNMYMKKAGVPLPDHLQNNPKLFEQGIDKVWVHSGFYNYVFNQTFEDSDDPSVRKYDEILQDYTSVINNCSIVPFSWQSNYIAARSNRE